MTAAASGVVDAAGNCRAGHRGRVSLSAPTAYAKSVIHPLVPSFLAAYPEVDVQLIFDDHDVDPLESDVDLVIRATSQPPQGLAARPLERLRWLLCASGEYLRERGTPGHPRELGSHDCIFLGETADDNRWRFTKSAGEKIGETVTVSVTRPLYRQSRERAAGGGRARARHCHAARVRRPRCACCGHGASRPRQARAYHGPVWLLYPPNRFLPPKVRALIDHLHAHLARQA